MDRLSRFFSVTDRVQKIAGLWNLIRRYRKWPLISVLIPVFNTDLTTLVACLTSVMRQSYPKWELCIVDDASTDPQVRQVLLAYALKDRRIKLVFSKTNGGIAATINKAARLAKGRFLGVLDHDDILEPDALMEYQKVIESTPDADVIYCDEDKIDESGRRCEPWYKSDWNPDLLLSFNYVMHFVLMRQEVFAKAGGVRKAYEGSQDYDLLLRVSELTDKIHHIPKILYHWRMGQGSIAGGPEAKPGVFVSGLAALQVALTRRGIEGQAMDAPRAWKGVYRVRRNIARGLTWSVLVYLRGDPIGLTRLLHSLQACDTTGCRQIIICPNGMPEGLPLELDPTGGPPIQWLPGAGTSPAQVFNRAAREADGDLLFFIDDSFEIRSSDTIRALMEQAQRPTVGAVGGKVYYPNGLVEHGGIIFGPFGLMGYAHRATPDVPGYAGLKNMIGNFSAVMGMGMMTNRSLFLSLNGFDEAFTVAYWDADYCLRSRRRGLRVTYTPYATFTHHRAIPSIEQMIVEPDATTFRARWQSVIDHDPYFNPNFSRALECFAVPEPLPEQSTCASSPNPNR